MKKLISLITMLSFFVGNPAFAAKTKWIKLKKANVAFKLPKKWKTYKNLLGLPLTMVSPMKKESRIVISLTPTGLKKKFLIPDDLKESQKDYRDGRLKYMREINGEILGFFPYETQKWPNVERVHTIGFKYKLGGFSMVERTYYFTCKTQMFHMKSKYREGEFPKGDKTIKKIVESFNCK